MTTQATTIGGTGTRPRPSLEELVDRLMAALFRVEPETAAPETTTQQSVARSVHEARRLRQAGDHRWRAGGPRRHGRGEG